MPERQLLTIEPKILYFGNPVALISSLNEDGSTTTFDTTSGWPAPNWEKPFAPKSNSPGGS